MPKQNITPEILAAAVQGLEAQRVRLDEQIAELKRMMGARPEKAAAQTEAPKRKRKMSAAGRKRIVEATRKRWAEFHRKKAEAAMAEPKKASLKKGRKKAKRVGRKTAAKGSKKVMAASEGAEQ